MANERYSGRNSEAARARRIKNKKRHAMFFRLVLVILVLAAAVGATTVFFRVNEVTVSGETRYTADELIATSGITEGDNMCFLNDKGVKSSLENTYPYLDTIKLKRHFPDTIEIAVTERTPLMTVKLDNGELFYVDRSGKVLEQLESEDEAGDTIMVVGTNSNELAVGETVNETDDSKIISVLDLLSSFEEYELLDKIIDVDITESFNVKVNYNDQYTLELGTLDNIDHKIQFLIAILKRDDLSPQGVIDLSSDKEARYRPVSSDTSGSAAVDTTTGDEQPAETGESTESTDGTADGGETDGSDVTDGETTDTESNDGAETDEGAVGDDYEASDGQTDSE